MKRMTTRLGVALATIAIIFPVLAEGAATITIINKDPAGVGFNDTTAATPVGGNTGTTVGEQRIIAFQKAADVWSSILDSDVEIRIEASFAPLECTATQGVLGSAGPIAIESDHPGAPDADTWYHIALANRQAGEDRAPGTNDINARFNGDLGKPNCLNGTFWYYGLDASPPNGGIDLVVVLLHEFAHGLGFSEFIDQGSGAFFEGIPDAYSRHLLDNTTGLPFVDMTLPQRRAALTSGTVVWTGSNVFEEAPDFLQLVPTLRVTSPGSVAGDYVAGSAQFGASISDGPYAGQLVIAEDASNSDGNSTTDGCTAILNPGAVAGKLAMVDRGTCTFVTKAKNVQAAGAIALIVVDNQSAGNPPINMAGTDASIIIPLISITAADGTTLKNAVPGGVQASIIGGPGLVGADTTGKVLIYAPSPFEPGSSTSHWDVSATPNLLMEPSINDDLIQDVDLTTAHFRDVGWFAEAGMEVAMNSGVTGIPDGPPGPGDSIRYQVDISQTSGSAATSVRLTTALDPNVTLIDGSVDVTKGDVVLGNENGDGTVDVSIGGLKPGAVASVKFDVIVNQDVPSGVTEVRSSATVSGSNFSSITKSSADEIAVNPMAATKTVSLAIDADESGSFTPGDTVRYQINLANTGTTGLSAIVVTDNLDVNLSTVQIFNQSSGTVTAGSTPGEKTVVWEVPALAAGSTATLVFDVLIDEEMPTRITYVLNQASIVGNGFTSTFTDNPSTAAPLDATSFGIVQPRRRATRR